MNKETQFQVHTSTDADFLRVFDKVSYLTCDPVRRLFEQRLEQGQNSFIIDFEHCVSVDSTFLGILVGLAIKLGKQSPPGKLALINLRGRNLETVKNLGIHKIAEICSNKITDNTSLEELKTLKGDKKASQETIYQAHKFLMELNDKNLKMFSDVVSYLEQNPENGN